MSRLQRMGWLALAAAALWAPAVPAAEVDPYVPADATAVASINLRQLLDAPLVRERALERIRAMLQENAGLQRMLAAAGVDPLRDVSGVVVAARGTKAEEALLIVHGKFDVERARKAAEEFARDHPDQMKIHQEGAAVVYENRSPHRPYFAAFADAGTAVAALSREPVAAAVRASGKQPPELRPELRALVSKADGTRSAWLAALAPPELAKQLAKSDNTAAIADKVKAFSATLDVDRDVQAAVHVYTTEAKTADSVAEMLESLRGLARLLAQNRGDFGDLLNEAVDSLKIGAGKSSVEVRVRVGGAAVAKALRKAR